MAESVINGRSDHYLRHMAGQLQRAVNGAQREPLDKVIEHPVSGYLDPAVWQAERRTIFARFPQIAAHVCELPEPGGWLAVDLAGRSVLLHRDANGQIGAFLNACRHRGMALLDDGERSCRSVLSCPYHGWSYAGDGHLRGLPHPEAFPGLEREKMGLVRLPCAEQHGFVWVCPEPGPGDLDVADWLGSIDADFRHFEMAGHILYAEGRSQVAANWKLCVEAFLEAYHVQVLHRQTVAPFFEDAYALSDTVGRHYRSGVARKGIEDSDPINLREHVSFTHFIYPNQFFIFHPDYVSQMSIVPGSEQHFRWHHRMLIPAGADTEAARGHWDRSFQLIDEGVFQSEDLRSTERIYTGLRSGANESVRFGAMEQQLAAFHRQLQQDIKAGDDA